MVGREPYPALCYRYHDHVRNIVRTEQDRESICSTGIFRASIVREGYNDEEAIFHRVSMGTTATVRQ